MRRGPWTFDDLRRVLESLGYEREEGASHPQWRHATRPGKVSLGENWTGVMSGHVVFKSVCRQADYDPKYILRLLNEL